MRIDVKQDSVWAAISGWRAGRLANHEHVDVCIIGAGIAGLSTAYPLSKAGLRVLVLDDGPIGGGQTGRTTAHLATALDVRYFELDRVRGSDVARMAAQSHAAAIDSIERVIADERIDCEFERLSGYLFLAPGSSADVLEKEEAAARTAGLSVERVGRSPLRDFDTGPCLRFAAQAQFNPMAYLGGLAQAISRAGGRIVTGVHADRVEGGKTVTIKTTDGQTVTASALVVATNSPINDRVAIHTKQAAYLSYVVALRVKTGALPHCLHWDTADPYHYVRLTAAPDGSGELLVVGGEDHRTGQASDQAERLGRLEAWARERFPTAGEVAYRWSGQIQMTADGLGFIGRNPGDEENVFVATGDSGLGMTHGTIAGLLLADLIAKRDNPWREVYEPSRKPLLGVGHFLRENADSALQYASWVTPGEVSSADDVRAGSGAVVRDGMTKLAVYRDETGLLHTCSAVCPHLRAIVSWNDVEKTWDCPAHGSRFDCRGKVIEGPANADLAPGDEPWAPIEIPVRA